MTPPPTDIFELFIAMAISVVMVLTTVLVHYEAISLISRIVGRRFQRPRLQVMAVIIGVFSAHTVEVWLYALAYYVYGWINGVPGIGGDMHSGMLDYLYFSTVSYTSLGLGDLYPLGALRLVTGVEALNGLLLIAWSASFTYLVMEKRWRL